MKKLGFNLMAFTHMHMNPHFSLADRQEHTDKLLEDKSHVLKVSGDLEAVMLSVHKDYAGFKKSNDRLIESYESKKLLSDKPVVHLYSMDQTENVIEHGYDRVF